MKKLIVLLFLLTFQVSAEVTYDPTTELFTMDPIINSDHLSRAAKYFYVSTSTTGWVYFSTASLNGIRATCSRDTPINESRLNQNHTDVLAKAPRWVLWKNDCTIVIGDGNGEIPYVETNSLASLNNNNAFFHKTRNNPQPLTKSTTNINGVEHIIYEAVHKVGEYYRPSDDWSQEFQCIIDSNSEQSAMLKKLKFDDIQIGIQYFLSTKRNILINGIPQCNYGRIWIIAKDLEVQ